MRGSRPGGDRQGWRRNVLEGVEVVNDVVSNQRAATEGPPVNDGDAERRVEVFVLRQLLETQVTVKHPKMSKDGKQPSRVCTGCRSYQLDGVDQRGEVRVGLVLLNDGGAQRFTCTVYEHLEKDVTRVTAVCFPRTSALQIRETTRRLFA